MMYEAIVFKLACFNFLPEVISFGGTALSLRKYRLGVVIPSVGVAPISRPLFESWPQAYRQNQFNRHSEFMTKH